MEEEQREAAHRLFGGAEMADGCTGSSAPVANAPAANRCWAGMGSVDVEDLALLFGDNRENHINFNVRANANPNHRVFRNRSVAQVATRNNEAYVNHHFNNSMISGQQYYGCEYESQCFGECLQNGYSQQQQQQQQQQPLRDQEDYVWSYNSTNKKIRSSSSERGGGHELPIGLGLPCTEDQWLACPATNCPVFDNTETNVAPTNWPTTTNHDAWNFYENKLNFGPVIPACIINGTLDSQHHATVYRDCYSHWEQEQQFLEDYLTNEKRKEKSRDAARCRRSRETDIFTELAGALPLTPDQAAHLDKASVMRLAIAYLKVRSVIDAPEPMMKSETSLEMDALFPKALDGFMLVLSSNGDMVYLSENVTDYLGVSQMDLMGQSVYEYSHPCDHDELRKCLSMKPADVKEKKPCSFFLRLKCTLTSKGRKVNLKSASYKVIHCMGRAMGSFEAKTERIADEGENSQDSESGESSLSKDEKESELDDAPSSVFGYNGASLVLVGCPIPHPSNIEVPLGRQTFLSKHNLNMKFTYADDRLAEYLGWESSELLGKSVFEFHHALDNSALEKSFKSLFSKGQCETTAYRFLGRRGGYAWVVTQATLIHCSKQHKPLSVVCVNHILSSIECEDEVYSERQLEARKTGSVKDSSASISEDFEAEDTLNLTSLPALVLETPSATNSEDFFDGAEETGDTKDRDDRNSQEKKKEIGQSSEYENDFSIVEANVRGKAERARPLAVTASIFRSQSGLQDSRKDLLPGATQLAPKVTKAPEARRPPWYFQDKPILEYEQSRNPRPQAVTRNLFVPLIQDQEIQQHELPPATCRPPPQTTTASIFAPRTEDMNKGFLTFSEDQPGLTMLKDEPEDLTHLAPTPGDVCVPLEDTPFLSDISLDEFILGTENYCPLLSPEGLPSSDLNDSLSKETPDIGESLESSLADGDPFIYRDIPSPCSLSPDLLSPANAALGKSPDASSIDSLQSPKHSDIVDGIMNIGTGSSVGNPITEDEMLMLSINDVIGDDELALRAPYIPMSDQDEALQLLISDDTVMWGPTQPPDKKIKWHDDEEKPISKRYEDSSLARLLKNESRGKKCNDHGGGLVDPTQIFGQISRGNNSSSNSSRLERPSKRVHAPISSAVPNESKRSRFQEDRLTLTGGTGGSVSPGLPTVSQSAVKQLNSPSYDEQCIDLCGLLAAEEKLETAAVPAQRGGSRLLLQQLMSRDHVQTSALSKTRDTSCSRTTRNECSAELMSGVEADIAASVDDKLNTRPSGDGGGMEPADPGTRGRRQSNSVLMNLLVSGCDKATGLTMPLHLLDKWSPMSVDECSDSQQLVPTNNRTVQSFFDEYSAVPAAAAAPAGAAQSNDFVNYFNDEAADLLLRSNMSRSGLPLASAQTRFVT